MPAVHKTYLGDGVYAIIEYNQVVLTTEDGVRTTNRIVLEPEVWFELKRFVEPEEGGDDEQPEPEGQPGSRCNPACGYCGRCT
jgi:hypothetical protein